MFHSYLQELSLEVQPRSEEDVKVKVVIPYLLSLGYTIDDMRFENSIQVTVGSKSTIVASDIEILLDGQPQIVIDTKNPRKTLRDKDVLQAVSYAKLVKTPAALFGFASNGIDLVGVNAIDGNAVDDIPTKAALIAMLQKRPPKRLSEIQLNEIRSTLLTIVSQSDLYRVIERCKQILVGQALIRSDQAFREITKLLLVKMNEERRAINHDLQNRFSEAWVKASSRADSLSPVEVFAQLFDSAKDTYPDIYDGDESPLRVHDDATLLELICELESYSFLGTGDDIKGAVYEIFLKSTLRGEFDQYFTPREIVDFMVNMADPQPTDKFVDPAAGSGGFLIRAFMHVRDQLSARKQSMRSYNQALTELTEKHIWGQEADYDLHVLAKINLIMHGDGWNHIYHGDSLKTTYLPDSQFDLVFENPPFTIPYTDKAVLSNYNLGRGKESEELDLLFVERSLRLLCDSGRLLIILPEGILNLPKYASFRKWLLKRVFVSAVVSLPAGAFMPFGRSASKTTILEVVKRCPSTPAPKAVFAANAVDVGFDTGKAFYRETNENDLPRIASLRDTFEAGVRYGGSSPTAWVDYSAVSSDRIDAGHLISVALQRDNSVRLEDLFDVDQPIVRINETEQYNYVEVPDFSDIHGGLGLVRVLIGAEINSSRMVALEPGDIYLTRINPRKRRIGVIPSCVDGGIVVSNEVYRLNWRENPYLRFEDRHAIIPLLRDASVTEALVFKGTGSSSSRSRVSADDVRALPIPPSYFAREDIAGIASAVRVAADKFWDAMRELSDVVGED